jgi:hypothetical protein
MDASATRRVNSYLHAAAIWTAALDVSIVAAIAWLTLAELVGAAGV